MTVTNLSAWRITSVGALAALWIADLLVLVLESRRGPRGPVFWSSLAGIIFLGLLTVADWKLARLEQLAEQEQQRLNRQYAPRRLTEAQQLALKEILSKHPPPPWPIQVHSVSGDAESASFGIHLAEAISVAGWPAQHENMAFFGAPHGLQVRVPARVQDPVEVPETDESSCPSCTVLAHALARAGQPAKVMLWPPTIVTDPPGGPIELVIGYKPLTKD